MQTRFNRQTLAVGGLVAAVTVGYFAWQPADPNTDSATQPSATQPSAGPAVPTIDDDLLNPPPALAPGTAKQIVIKATDGGLEPAEIVVPPGRGLIVILRNDDDDDPHALEFVIPGRDPMIERQFITGDKQQVSFLAPERPGTYTYYCTVPGHAERGELGTLVVTANPDADNIDTGEADAGTTDADRTQNQAKAR